MCFNFILFITYSFITSNKDIPNHQINTEKLIKIDCLTNENIASRINSTTSICINNCTFNSIGSYSLPGGAIYISLNIPIENINIIENSLFRYCYSSRGGAIYYISQNPLNFTIQNSHFINNSVINNEAFGGAIYIDTARIKMAKCTFIENRITSEVRSGFCNGGSIYITNSDIELLDCTISKNQARSSLEDSTNYGGGLYVVNSKGHLNNCIFDGQTCSEYYSSGCSIYIQSSEINFDECQIINSYSSGMGGAGGGIMMNYSNSNFYRCIFNNNSIIMGGSESQSNGGALAFTTANVSLIECTFNNNVAYSSSFCTGGALMTFEGNFTIEKCQFYGNKADIGEIFYIMDMINQVIKLNDNVFDRSDIPLNAQNSLFYFQCDDEIETVFVFTNNQVRMKDSASMFVFDGTNPSNGLRKWEINNNCLYPLEQIYFKGNSFSIYNADGTSLVNFNDAFQTECTYPTETDEITQDFEFFSSYDPEIISYSSNYVSSFDLSDMSSFQLPESTPVQLSFSYSISYIITYIQMRSVSYSLSMTSTDLYTWSYDLSFNSQIYIYSNTYTLYFFPYIIYYFSPSYTSTFLINFFNLRIYITSEQLIGICCGSAAILFFIIYIIIFTVRKAKSDNYIFEEDSDLFCNDEDEVMIHKGDINICKLNDEPKQQEDDHDINEERIKYDLDFWL